MSCIPQEEIVSPVVLIDMQIELVSFGGGEVGNFLVPSPVSLHRA